MNLKCKRYLETEGRRCGHPRAERRYVVKAESGERGTDILGKPQSGQGQYVGTFCFPCWIEVMETLPLRMFFSFTPPPGSYLEERAREAVRTTIDNLRKTWQEEVEKHEARLRNAG